MNTRVPVFHADLYRLKDQSEVDELGLEGLLANLRRLDRMAGTVAASAHADVLSVTPFGARWTAQRPVDGDRRNGPRRWTGTQSCGTSSRSQRYAGAQRIFFEGDASSRRYETLSCADWRTCAC